VNKIEIFDPAMCCSTGVCGPAIDTDLLRIATVVNALKEKGIIIKRHNLSSEPQDFISNKVINNILQEKGADILPVTLLNGEIVKTKKYPTDSELAKWLNIKIDSKPPKKSGCCCCCDMESCDDEC
jgi:hypothetical protein